MGDDNRHHVMESLFGAESEESDDEPSGKPSYSTSAHSANSARDDDEGDAEGGGEAEVESYVDGAESERAVSDGGQEDVESEAERGDGSERDEASDREAVEPELSVSGSENYRGSEYMEHEVEQAREASDQGEDDLPYDQGSEQGIDHMEDEQGENEQGEEEAHYEQHDDELEDEPVERTGRAVEDEEEEGENEHVDEEPVDEEEHNELALATVPATRDVFGDSDEDEEEERTKRRDMSPMDRPEARNLRLQRIVQSDDERGEHGGEQADLDVVPYDDAQYDSDDYRQSERKRAKPVGPPLELDIPLRRPPGRANQLNLVRVSNIMGIESKPFDPKTYEEESSTFVTDADGRKQRLRLEGNVVRWRVAENRDGTRDYESNARFVKWSDGSLQLFLGSEVLDIAVQDARQDQSHLFMRHPKMVLQSQGRLAQKMKFMPSSLSSKSHKLLTALVDSRNKKVLKVKSVITNFDPDKEKEVQEKAVEQRIRSKTDLQRKQDKITRKYIMPTTRDREAQLSPGYLEGALEEEEEADDYDKGARRGADSRRFEQQIDAERGAERRIMNSKRQPPPPSRRPAVKDRRPPHSRHLEDSEEEEREESEYETDPEDEDLEAGEEAEFEDEEVAGRFSERGMDKRRNDRFDEDKKRRRVSEEPDPEQSPPRKSNQRRRRVVDSEDEDD